MRMKKQILGLACALFLASAFVVQAAEVASNKTSFDIGITGISNIPTVEDILFGFKPIHLVNTQNIASWKVRVYCDKSMKMAVNQANKDHCGQAVTIPATTAQNFSVTFKNGTADMKDFSFKLKAYDKNGKWLHTATKNLRWK